MSLEEWEKTIDNVQELYRQGRYKEALFPAEEALELALREFGDEHPNTAVSLNYLGGLYDELSDYKKAERAYRKALAIREQALPEDHPDVAASLNNLAVFYRGQGRYEEAESLYHRLLAVLERALPAEHPHIADSLNNLAELYRAQGRYEEAERLYWRALEIWRRGESWGPLRRPNFRGIAAGLINLAVFYHLQGRYEEAMQVGLQALKIREQNLPPDHPDIAASLNILARVYDARGLDSEPLYERAQAIWERKLGPHHPDVAIVLKNRAERYFAQDRYKEAEQLYKRTFAIWERALPPDHPNVAISLQNLAKLYHAQGRYREALPYARRATDIYRRRAAGAGEQYTDTAISELKLNRYTFLWHLSSLAGLLDDEPAQAEPLIAEAFETMQLALASATAAAVNRMAARFAKGDDRLALIVRARQDAIARLQVLDALLVEVVSKAPQESNAEAQAVLRQERGVLAARFGELGVELHRDFPDYAELITPLPLPLGDALALLAPDEALLAYLFFSPDTSYLMAVRRERVGFYRVPVPLPVLAATVARLRTQLDLRGIDRVYQIRARLPLFEVKYLYLLYQALVAPAEDLLAGVRHIFLVPDGPLQSLPLGVLLTEPPPARLTKLRQLQRLSWLTKRYAITVLPSVSALKALRHTTWPSRACKPFLGIGDPVLSDCKEEPAVAGLRRANVHRLLRARGPVEIARAVHEMRSLHPVASEELEELSNILGGTEDDLWLGEKAAVPRVRHADLKVYRVLAFATHALVSNELTQPVEEKADGEHTRQTLGHEPALIMTPPKPEQASADDDGLLRASDIVKLELDAEWVILSCCNTAASDGTPGAEGLSGLAKAFLYAGARALLVSHWTVESEATKQLITRMMNELRNHTEIGRAEALRRAMVSLIDDPSEHYLAHPAFWAPFVVVGEGGTLRPVQ